MRASLLAVSAAFALATLSPVLAQSPPDKPAEAQSSTPREKGDDVLSPSRLPKARQGVKEEGGQVGALSPEERQRPDRVRAKADAAKAEAAAKASAVKAEAAKAPEIKDPMPPKSAEIKTPARSKGADIKPPEPPKAAEAKTPPRDVLDAPAPATRKADAGAHSRHPHPTRHATRRSYAPAPDSADLDESGGTRRPRSVPPVWHPDPRYAEDAPDAGEALPPGAPYYVPQPRYGEPYPPPRGGYENYRAPQQFYGEPY